MATSRTAPDRRIGPMDGLDRANSGLFTKKFPTFLEIISQSEERARAPEQRPQTRGGGRRKGGGEEQTSVLTSTRRRSGGGSRRVPRRRRH
jgi:hypothetical protein